MLLGLTLLLLAGAKIGDDTTDSLMSRGISRQLALARAAQIAGVRYALDLSVAKRDTADGRVAIHFQKHGPGDVIVDFRGPSVADVEVNGSRVQPETNGAHLRFPATLFHSGENRIDLRFETLIAPAGASIIRFHDDTDGNDYLYTLLVPADANALFPCFDQPDIKARLTLTLDVPPAWTALANGITERVDSSAAKKTFSFRETEPLPTYLIAFAAGPWRRFSGGPRHTNLFVRASRAGEVEVDSLQNQVGAALASLESYFGVPYPFQQFQFMLAPAFPFGGMEHPGVTMFNEESFIYREPPTLNQRLARRATIYHEVAHQWFGDYVTMRWFDDLWLKEGFATYMGTKMVALSDRSAPETDAGGARPGDAEWMSFYLRNKPAAYDVDVTAGTTPIWQSLANLDQAKSNYGAIVYNKAPGVLKQLDYLVGDSAFRAGVHQFLIAHPYGNATWRDLLEAIGTAARTSLRDWGAQYILRPGLPVIEQRVDVHDGSLRRIVLVQHPAQPALSGTGTWPIRTELVLSRGGRGGGIETRVPVEIRSESTVVRNAGANDAPDFVYANAGDHAYALVMLDPRSASWLEPHIGDVHDTFLRAMLWGSLWDLVRDARLAPTRFLASAIRELPRERDEQIAAGMLSRTSRAVDSYLSPLQRDSISPQLEAVLLSGAEDRTRSYGVRKSQLDAYIALARTPAAIARLDGWLDSSNTAGMPLRQPTRWAIVTTLVARGASGSLARLAAEERHDTTTGGRRRAFVAGAARPEAAVKHAYFARYFRDSTLNEDWVTASLRTFNEPEQASLTLPFLRPALDTLPWIQRNRRIFFLGSWLGAFVAGQRSAAALRVVDDFLRAHPKLPADLRQKILQTRDDLERTVRIRGTYADGA